MAMAANTVWEVRATGNDLNGGGFVQLGSGQDYSQSDTPTASASDLFVHATVNTRVAPATGYTPITLDVGNVINISGGAGWTPGFYQIVSITSGMWDLDRSPAATNTTGGVFRLGGAVASPGYLIGTNKFAASNTMFIKSGTYNITSNSTGVSGGRVGVVPAGASASARSMIIGYNTTRTVGNNDASRPTMLMANGVTGRMFEFNGTMMFRNVIVDVNGNVPAASMVFTSTGSLTENVTVQNWGDGYTGFIGFDESTGPSHYTNCHVLNSGTATTGSCFNLASRAQVVGCIAEKGETGFRYVASTPCIFVNCVAVGAAQYGFQNTSSSQYAHHSGCVAIGCGSAGFRDIAGNFVYVNCISQNNGYGWYGNAGLPVGGTIAINCASYNNTSGRGLSSAIDLFPINATGNMFVNTASDLSPNSTADAGALLVDTAYPASWVKYAPNGRLLDVGAVQQYLAPSGGGGSFFGGTFVK